MTLGENPVQIILLYICIIKKTMYGSSQSLHKPRLIQARYVMMVTVKVLTMSKISLVLYSAAQVYTYQNIYAYTPNTRIVVCIYSMHMRVSFITWAYPKGSPRLKLPLIFVCIQSQIAVWVLKRLHASLLVVSAHAQVRTSAHGKKIVDLSPALSLKGSMTTMISSTLKPKPEV